jgi:dihydrofolate reductase
MHGVVYYVASSIDGFLAPEDGSLDWLAPFSASGEDHGYTGFYAAVDALVVGSRTYEQMLALGEWPHQDRPVTVMSSRAMEPAGDMIALSRLEPGGVVDSLRAAGHQRTWLMGGGTLAGSFEHAGLIDEYIISYVPVILGSGVGLFGGRTGPRPLALVEQMSFGDGIVQCHYRRGD